MTDAQKLDLLGVIAVLVAVAPLLMYLYTWADRPGMSAQARMMVKFSAIAYGVFILGFALKFLGVV
jgi:hypothetical protein